MVVFFWCIIQLLNWFACHLASKKRTVRVTPWQFDVKICSDDDCVKSTSMMSSLRGRDGGGSKMPPTQLISNNQNHSADVPTPDENEYQRQRVGDMRKRFSTPQITITIKKQCFVINTHSSHVKTSQKKSSNLPIKHRHLRKSKRCSR